jgi:hypothetical protein
VPEKEQVVPLVAQFVHVADGSVVPVVVIAAVCKGPDATGAVLVLSVVLPPPQAAREATNPAPIARRVRKVVVGEKMSLRMKVLVVKLVKAMIFYKKTPTENHKKCRNAMGKKTKKATASSRKLDGDQQRHGLRQPHPGKSFRLDAEFVKFFS